MYTGVNAKKQRKQTRIEALQSEVKQLQKLLGTMMHLHERLKNERIESDKGSKVSTLPSGTHDGSGRAEMAHSSLSPGSSGEPTNGKDQKGA